MPTSRQGRGPAGAAPLPGAPRGRRRFLAGAGGLLAGVGLARTVGASSAGAPPTATRSAPTVAASASASPAPHPSAAPPPALATELRAAPASVSLVGEAYGSTAVWAFNGSVPGPVLRLRRGETLRAGFVNALPEASTVHWHGIRLANAMDGVPHLTQPPVEPGGRFHYEFGVPDSGTYWYHPHLGTPEQVDRGLSGVLVVDDVDPPEVDRELVWLLDDWRLDRDARIVDDFLSFFDVAHGGRLGNTVTVNGRLRESEPMRSGERVRLRIVNAANARVFALRFEGHRPWLIALDGQPLPAPRRLDPEHRVLIGPGMRADLVIDCLGEPGSVHRVVDLFSGRGAYRLLDLRYASAGAPARARSAGRDAPRAAAPNPLAEPVLHDALRIDLGLGGGMMGSGWPQDSPAERARRRARRLAGAKEADPAWTVNGRAHLAHGPGHGFEFTAQRGQTVLLRLRNDTAWWHPLHLHGHSWRELSRNGEAIADSPWRDTSLLAPGDTVDVAFVADNPGDWLLHCHVLEHHAGGMGIQFRVL